MPSRFAIAVAGLLLGGCANLSPEWQDAINQAAGTVVQGQGQGQGGGGLGEADIAAGLKEALATGTQRAIGRIGILDGFWKNPALRIPLPENVLKIEKTLRMLGQGNRVDEFHLSLNRAAEKAVPEAAQIFGNAIRGMTLSDARGILNGGTDAATQFFRERTTAALTARFKPIVTQATDSVGATRKYKDLAGKVGRYVNFEAQDLDAYVTDEALSGLFQTLAEEEKRIRQDPSARTSELLRKVFGPR